MKMFRSVAQADVSEVLSAPLSCFREFMFICSTEVLFQELSGEMYVNRSHIHR